MELRCHESYVISLCEYHYRTIPRKLSANSATFDNSSGHEPAICIPKTSLSIFKTDKNAPELKNVH